MKKLYNMDLNEYHGKIVYIHFDPYMNKCEKIKDDTLKANMVKPHLWDEAINKAESMLEKTEPGTMIFGSALNLLLFSEIYKESILNKMVDILQNDKSRVYAFAVSTTALANEI